MDTNLQAIPPLELDADACEEIHAMMSYPPAMSAVLAGVVAIAGGNPVDPDDTTAIRSFLATHPITEIIQQFDQTDLPAAAAAQVRNSMLELDSATLAATGASLVSLANWVAHHAGSVAEGAPTAEEDGSAADSGGAA